MKPVRKRYMLVYPRQRRAFIKPRRGWELWTSSIDHLLMCSTDVQATLNELTKRDQRGLRIVEVPL